MDIVQPYAHMHAKELVNNGAVKKLQLIEEMARKSHLSESAGNSDSWYKFLESVVVKKGDWSITRHATFTCEFRVSLGVAAELRTHKSGQYTGNDIDAFQEETDEWHHGFTQSSTRFVNYTKQQPLQCVIPVELLEAYKLSVASPHHTEEQMREYLHQMEEKKQAIDTFVRWQKFQQHSEDMYNFMVNQGYSPQVARGVLTRDVAAYLGVTYTINQWRYFFLMRTTKQTHPHMKYVTVPLLQEFQREVPLFFNDITPGQSQSYNLRMPW